MSYSEKQIEQKLTLMVKAKGGIAPKFVSPSFAGMPDRLRALQVARHRMLRELGFKVYVIDGIEQIGGMLNEITG